MRNENDPPPQLSVKSQTKVINVINLLYITHPFKYHLKEGHLFQRK